MPRKFSSPSGRPVRSCARRAFNSLSEPWSQAEFQVNLKLGLTTRSPMAQVPVIVWLAYYAEKTRGVQVMDNATTILGWKSEPQPDGLLRILPERGGRTWNQGGFVHGAPEFVVEVAKATRYVDLGPKLADYQQAGVLEYVVHAMDPDEIFWFGQEKGVLVQRPIGGDGLYRSTAFPGLWLDPQALLTGDRQRLRTVLDVGCATPEHAAFVGRLAVAGNTM